MTAPRPHTSSARPDLLDQAAQNLTRSGRRLHDAASLAQAAASDYRHACPDYPLDLSSFVPTSATVIGAADLAADVTGVADAFRRADTSPSSALAVATDRELSLVIATHHRSLGSQLTGPTRAAAARGRSTARAMVKAGHEGGAAGAVARLSHSREDLKDPVFLAAVFNELGPDRLMHYVEELAGSEVQWHVGIGPLNTLAEAWARATHTLDQPDSGVGLDLGLVHALLGEPIGRNVMRLLAGASGVASGRAYIRRTVDDLLFGPIREDADLSATWRLLRGADRESDPRAAVLRAIGLTPGAGLALMADRRLGSTLEQRVDWLLHRGEPGQVGAAMILRQWLDQPDLQPTDAGIPRDRAEVLRTVYDWAAGTPEGGVTEPMAQLLADTVATDIGLLLGRLGTARAGTLLPIFTAITEFDRPWITALLALEAHTLQRVDETLHATVDIRITALAGLSDLHDTFEAAAAKTDRPPPSSPLGWMILDKLVAPLTAAVIPGAAPIVKTAVQSGLKMVLDEWQKMDPPEPGDHAQQTRARRAALRRLLWVVVARDPVLGGDLNWAVGGASGEETLGGRITGVHDLTSLDGGGADIDELAAWAAAQPEHLRALVASYDEQI